ncbi:aminotransferase class I/II-fold pyridoxal phosphate-dependent enzyme [Melghirimyces algeriensis]|uniref:Histidinol-phosphate aminotransferase n=1 Tax=Melghirimyces algeriensis TaxID=910412 RepID=A0A521FE85_9BACL|nr:aminotransferase class I/II-fold pyridoxal phosphate-dependent enzyme [Melghirimyces algeriensis]SMO94409.1 histidinol-phosphate aminotransferase [Melghirimyces algeriensis]
MSTKPPRSQIVSHLPATVPFTAPETLERQTGIKIHLRLGANESTYGISPKAYKAMQECITESHLYGDSTHYDLRKELATLHRIKMEEISVGGGIDELLGWIARVYLNPGDSVTTSLGGYPTFNYHVKGFGGILHEVPYRNGKNDLEGLLQTAVKTKSRILYLANPDNPTGTWFTKDELKDFRSQIPEDCLLVLDEAYIEFAPDEAVLPVDPADPGIIRTRTFSKAHGLAGARIGYAITHREIVQSFDKIRNHFGVNRMAQAGALASLKDPDFLQQVVKHVAKGRQEYAKLAEELGFSAYPSATNFVAIDVGSAERATSIREALWEQGVFIRVPNVPPLNHCLRISVGTPKEQNLLAHILRKTVHNLV